MQSLMSIRSSREVMEEERNLMMMLMIDFMIYSCLETVSSYQMDVSEAISLCWRTMLTIMIRRASSCMLEFEE